MKRFLMLWLLAFPVAADSQLDALKAISTAGAPFLTLSILDKAQPGEDQDLYEWILWEQERYRILQQWKQWNPLLLRLESLPDGLPEPFLQQAASLRIRAYLEISQFATARKLLREQLWNEDAQASPQYRVWRKMVIESYLDEGLTEDARVAMLRYQQDFDESDVDWLLLRARVLMELGRYEQVSQLLKNHLDWSSMTMRLLAEYRSGQHTADVLWDLAQKRLEVIQDDEDQARSYWSLAVEAARNRSASSRVLALEQRLSMGGELQNLGITVTADQLWLAYRELAVQLGNSHELLVGDDQSWLQLANGFVKSDALKARSLLAYLLLESATPETRKQAAASYLSTLDENNPRQRTLLDQVFSEAQLFQDAEKIPLQIRFKLVDQAIAAENIDKAAELMLGLESVPDGVERFDWLLRQARVLLLGGNLQQGNQKLKQLLSEYQNPTAEDTDHILQVLFDLQTLQADDLAIAHFRSLMNKPIEPRQKREILFWMADSFKGMQDYQKASLLYLQSALFSGSQSMDPWGRTARFKAAEALEKANMVDDARRIYQSLLKVTQEASRRSVLQHKIQQLWLMQRDAG